MTGMDSLIVHVKHLNPSGLFLGTAQQLSNSTNYWKTKWKFLAVSDWEFLHFPTDLNPGNGYFSILNFWTLVVVCTIILKCNDKYQLQGTGSYKTNCFIMPLQIVTYIKLVPYVTAVDSERRRQLANVIAIAKAFANWTETLPNSKPRDTKTRTDIKNLLRTKIRYCSVVSESVVICQLT